VLTLFQPKQTNTKKKPTQHIRGAEREEFAQLLATEGLYRVRVKPQHDIEGANNKWIMASIPICELVKSGFKEEMKFLFDNGAIDGSSVASVNSLGDSSGKSSSTPLQLLSMDYRVPTSRFTKAKDCHAALPDEIRFSSAASFNTATPAQVNNKNKNKLHSLYVDNSHQILHISIHLSL
jgi:hypothetical protein